MEDQQNAYYSTTVLLAKYKTTVQQTQTPSSRNSRYRPDTLFSLPFPFPFPFPCTFFPPLLVTPLNTYECREVAVADLLASVLAALVRYTVHMHLLRILQGEDSCLELTTLLQYLPLETRKPVTKSTLGLRSAPMNPSGPCMPWALLEEPSGWICSHVQA